MNTFYSKSINSDTLIGCYRHRRSCIPHRIPRLKIDWEKPGLPILRIVLNVIRFLRCDWLHLFLSVYFAQTVDVSVSDLCQNSEFTLQSHFTSITDSQCSPKHPSIVFVSQWRYSAKPHRWRCASLLESTIWAK